MTAKKIEPEPIYRICNKGNKVIIGYRINLQRKDDVNDSFAFVLKESIESPYYPEDCVLFYSEKNQEHQEIRETGESRFGTIKNAGESGVSSSFHSKKKKTESNGKANYFIKENGVWAEYADYLDREKPLLELDDEIVEPRTYGPDTLECRAFDALVLVSKKHFKRKNQS